jgi:hypothetical protein
MKEDTVKKYRVTMSHSRYGHPEPRIEVRFEKGTSFRKVHAALHLLAAAVELATPDGERWIAQMVASSADCAGWIYLELSQATEDEARRGLAMLHSVTRAYYTGELA